jgi:hypothetical protein
MTSAIIHDLTKLIQLCRNSYGFQLVYRGIFRLFCPSLSSVYITVRCLLPLIKRGFLPKKILIHLALHSNYLLIFAASDTPVLSLEANNLNFTQERSHDKYHMCLRGLCGIEMFCASPPCHLHQYCQ